MPIWRYLVFLAALLLCSSLAWAQYAQDDSDSEKLFAPSLAQKFYELAYEIANAEDINESEIEQAVIFFTATAEMDSRANYLHPGLIELVTQNHAEQDYSLIVYNSLAKYLEKSSDLNPARQAVQYLLGQLNHREQREMFLTDLLSNLKDKNASFDSELAALIGLLAAEKADVNSAQYNFLLAFSKNKYNKLAFDKIVELMPEQVSPSLYLEHFRLMLGENPLNLDAALAFAQYARQMELYETSADAYEYCAKLFGYLYPDQELPSHISVPWMLVSYNAGRYQNNCLQIASQLRQGGDFDLFIEALAAKAAIKIGNAEHANRIFQTIEEKINSQPSIIGSQSIAWFYCFASPDANKALDWANRAYAADPNSTTAAAILAYSLVMNSQTDWAKPLIDKYEKNQIADLTLAFIQLTDGQKDTAIVTLKSAIAKDPASLEAERAKQILAGIGGEYFPSVDPDITLMAMRNTFGQTIVPAFVSPEKIISAQLNFRGSEFSYGTNIDCTAAITNNSAEPLVISDDGLFTGNIRVDANITGDLNQYTPNLVSVKIRPASPIPPGGSFFVPMRLFTGRLRQLLITHPQASLEIEFTIYLDPVVTDKGQIISGIPGLKPTVVAVNRPKIEIIDRYLKNRIGSLTKGQQGQKIKTAQLFIGLLLEQDAMAGSEPAYEFTFSDSMPPLIKTALLKSLTFDDWVVKVHILADMSSLHLDYEFMTALSENLDDTHWPVRLMTIYLLSKNQGESFNRVLDWAAKYDSNKFVRAMAVALGGTPPPPPPQEQPAQTAQQAQQQPFQSSQSQQPPTQPGQSQQQSSKQQPAQQPKQQQSQKP